MHPPPLLPDQEAAFQASPALRFRSVNYPSRFEGRVPRFIRLLSTVRPSFPLKGAAAVADQVYLAWTNSYGAVAAILPDGQLGVTPAEFEVVEWADPSYFQPTGKPNG